MPGVIEEKPVVFSLAVGPNELAHRPLEGRPRKIGLEGHHEAVSLEGLGHILGIPDRPGKGAPALALVIGAVSDHQGIGAAIEVDGLALRGHHPNNAVGRGLDNPERAHYHDQEAQQQPADSQFSKHGLVLTSGRHHIGDLEGRYW